MANCGRGWLACLMTAPCAPFFRLFRRPSAMTAPSSSAAPFVLLAGFALIHQHRSVGGIVASVAPSTPSAAGDA